MLTATENNTSFSFTNVETLDLVDLDDEIDQLFDELNIDKNLAETAAILCEDRDRNFEEEIIKDEYLQKEGTNLAHITSIVGDDLITTTNSGSFSPAIFSAGKFTFKIKISEHDTGFSHEVGNYAEGYILMPITTESGFDSVNRRHLRNGVPYVLDHVKLKQLSAVRKQSSLELDFESKYSRLCETVSWVDRDWFTYDFHQISLVLATAIFSFKTAKNFPFLFKSEGGCGMFPPYKNLDTAASALYHFNSGKSKETILSIMNESVNIIQNFKPPKEGIYIRGTHLAQMGKELYTKYLTSFSFLKNLPDSEKEWWNRFIFQEEDEIPLALQTKGVTIESTDHLLGSTISKLRTDGLIMTELDVKIALAGQFKIESLLGNDPMRKILDDLATKKKEMKELPWKELPKYLPDDQKAVIPDVYERGTLLNYYEMHLQKPFISSFQYEDEVRAYVAEDVVEYLIKINKNLRSEVVNLLPVERGLKQSFKTTERARDLTFAQKWIRSKPLDQLLMNPIPSGIGPDDSRIMRDVYKSIAKDDENYETRIVLIITADRQLIDDIGAILKRLPKTKEKSWIIIQLKTKFYLRECVQNTFHFNQSYIYNWITKRTTSFPNVQNYLESFITDKDRFYFIDIKYDIPNIARMLENCRVNKQTKDLWEYTNGYIPRDYLLDNRDWLIRPLDEIKSWDFWQSSVKYPFKGGRKVEMGFYEINNDFKSHWTRS